MIPDESVDLVYMDPPFFTGKLFKGRAREDGASYLFSDIWGSWGEYYDFLYQRVVKCRRVLKNSGSIFVHCDRSANHIIRMMLENVFGRDSFQSEIIWTYKRWSNAKKGLMNQHQNILFFSKSKEFKWNQTLVEYSATTNLDQILQKRERDSSGTSVYARDKNGEVVYGGAKKGVPLGDVWDIPYLNPKAKERTGYPTQKPLVLLERIVGLVTDKGDVVLDPFCGSGTTLVAAQSLQRQYIGIDVSEEAVLLTEKRLSSPLVRTESKVLKKGLASFERLDPWVERHLVGFEYSKIHRNSGLDGILNQEIEGKTVFLKVQKEEDSLEESYKVLLASLQTRPNSLGVLIQTKSSDFVSILSNVVIFKSLAFHLREEQVSIDF
ncbi:site-specific DNA-methyltransferase [uncultured Acinetobacter sp.]|uniref:DNA-methyltransferase n=1 Tax=uncultured Acinetobacter sp. TaxID=165433 RepID=UPI00260FCAB2|nr:site-specific DNA-methyltransferase [uncultured Acinetobacter sp.]